MSAGLEAGIEGAAHAMPQRRQERTTSDPEERADGEAEEGSTVA